jgi:hypothetical protein
MCSGIISVKQISSHQIFMYDFSVHVEILALVLATSDDGSIFLKSGTQTLPVSLLPLLKETKENSILSERTDACQSQKWQQRFR